mmetsp:Transcript_12184/g.19808  ORF Transcript_12184/g.19808 Transcript_12184/m.19808 type:complete len:126 (+) Transcript_12184:204-581(+)
MENLNSGSSQKMEDDDAGGTVEKISETCSKEDKVKMLKQKILEEKRKAFRAFRRNRRMNKGEFKLKQETRKSSHGASLVIPVCQNPSDLIDDLSQMFSMSSTRAKSSGKATRRKRNAPEKFHPLC